MVFNYSDLKIDELKKECKKRGLTKFTTLRKNEIIQLLEDNDKNCKLDSQKVNDIISEYIDLRNDKSSKKTIDMATSSKVVSEDAKKSEDTLNSFDEHYNEILDDEHNIREIICNNDGDHLVSGVLEVMEGGFGFLRRADDDNNSQAYVPPAQIKRFKLRTGDTIIGLARKMSDDNNRLSPLIFIQSVNGESPSSAKTRKKFSSLIPIYPNERLQLEYSPEKLSTRILDLCAPIGKGQRGLIVSPPKAGKTSMLKEIAIAIEKNYPELHLFILLIDERPEEVTDIINTVNKNRTKEGPETQVIASTFDRPVQNHAEVTETLLERTMRLVESGEDVVILMDSITRLSRAYNIITPPSGRTLSGGLDPAALYTPKKFFGAARNIEDGGSLTILATCLKDTGSRMDDMIYEEFKGTGNMELHLSREISEKRIFPAVDIFASGTRRDDLLVDENQREVMLLVRDHSNEKDTVASIKQLVKLLKNTKSNEQFCSLLLKQKS